MLWSPTGPTVTTTLSPGAAQPFVPPTSLNLGGVARVFGGAALSTFTLGGSTVTNTLLIPLGIGQDIVIAYSPTDTHIIASAADVRITPGIARP